MKRRMSVMLAAVMFCSMVQPAVWVQAEETTAGETASARYIVKYVQRPEDESDWQETVSEAYQAVSQKTEPAVQMNSLNQESNALLEKTEAERETEQITQRAVRKRIQETEPVQLEQSVAATALETADETQAYGVVQLEKAVPAEAFMEALEQQAEGIVEYIQPDYEMELSSFSAARPSLTLEELPVPAELAQPEETAIPSVENPAETETTEETAPSNGQTIVALLDTGVDMNHPDLAGHVIEGYDFYHNTSEIAIQEDSLADVHGTHLAGVIAGNAPEAKIMPLKVFDNGTAYTSDIIRAIAYAQEQGAAIVNCSWGSTDNNPALREAMEESQMLFICAAGNNRANMETTPVYPAAFGLPNTISVASQNQDLGMSYYSNYGTSVDIAAVGREVTSTYPGGEYGEMNGTSVSAAVVTGAAAAYAGQNGTENLKGKLKTSADKLSCLENKVQDGNSLSKENLLAGAAGQAMTVYPADDFDVLGYERTPAENWELFSSLETVKVASGLGFSLFLKGDGTVWACGSGLTNSYDDLVLTPTQIPGLTDIVEIAAGYSAMALRSDGTVYWCKSIENVPNQVVGLDSVKSIAVGTSPHQLVVKNDGTVWGWGENTWGEAGGREVILEENEWGTLLVGFEYVSVPTKIMKLLNYDPYIEPLGNAKKVYAGDEVSYILDNGNKVWILGYGGSGFYPDSNCCCARVCSENVKELAVGTSPMKTEIKLDGTVQFYKGTVSYGYDASAFQNAKAINGNLIVKEDGTVWRFTYKILNDPEFQVEQITGIEQVNSVSYAETNSSDGQIYHALMVKDDGSVWGVGDNYYGEQGNGTTEPVLTPQMIMEAPIIIKKVIVDEQYNTADNAAYRLNQEGLQELGWSECDDSVITSRGAYDVNLGEFSAADGVLTMQKTGSIEEPTEADDMDLVYGIKKTFTYRQDNWNNDPRVSVWTQHFKGDYIVEIDGSFHQKGSQVYYDMIGHRSNGTEEVVARYRVDPGTNANFSVYNNKLNGGNVTSYPLFTNPAQRRVIATQLSSEDSTFQTFVNNAATASQTTVSDANPKDTFSMTGWNKGNPGAYLTGIRISVQKQAQTGNIAKIYSLRLMEVAPQRDMVDEAIDELSMGVLTDTPEAVIGNLKQLPQTLEGAEITWSSSRPDLIDNEGNFVGEPPFDTDVVMTAQVTNPNDGFTKYVEFRLSLPPQSGFQESYTGSVTGTPSSAGSEGTKTFEELPMWEFSYPGISNGTNGEVHTGQILMKDGYLIFKKISNRQTDSYGECVVGVRSLSNISPMPSLQSVNIAFTAKVRGTGTMRFAPLTTDGKAACTVMLDASKGTVSVLYGETSDGEKTQTEQRLTDIDPMEEHLYELQLKSDGTFVFKIDGNTITTAANEQTRLYLPGVTEDSMFSQLKVWITNITHQNMEIGKLKNLSITGGQWTKMIKQTIQVSVHTGETHTFAMGGANTTKWYEIKFDPDFFDFVQAPTPAGVTIEGVTDGSIKIMYTAVPPDVFEGILCRFNLIAKKDGQSSVSIYESEVE